MKQISYAYTAVLGSAIGYSAAYLHGEPNDMRWAAAVLLAACLMLVHRVFHGALLDAGEPTGGDYL